MNWKAMPSMSISITCGVNSAMASSRRCAAWAIAWGRRMAEINRSDEPAFAPEPRRRVCADLGAGGGLDAQRPAKPDDVFPRPAAGGVGADGRRVDGATAGAADQGRRHSFQC